MRGEQTGGGALSHARGGGSGRGLLLRLTGAAAIAALSLLGTALEASQAAPPPSDSQATTAPAPKPRKPTDLPLLELKAKHGDTLAVILSGDGGWTGIDRKIARVLSTEKKVAVVGINSKIYFKKPQDPDRAARDLARVLRYYLPAWKRDHALLVGYSLGADALPFLAARLPPDLLDKVSLIALLSPTFATRLRVEEPWTPGVKPPPPGKPIRPEVEKLRGRPMLCLYGTMEDDSLCPDLPAGLAHVLEVPGGHAFKRDFQGITAKILAAVPKEGAAAPSR